MNRFLFALLGTLSLITASALMALYIDAHAFVWIFAMWVVVFVIGIIKAANERKKMIAIYTTSVLIAVFLAEFYFSGILSFRYEAQNIEQELYEGEYVQENEFLGFALVPNSSWWVKYSYGDSLSYDVRQSTNANGLRQTTGEHKPDAAPILFFGCSFTFGHGLLDHETLPSIFQGLNHGQFEAINMGQSGFGIHQTLSILENSLEKPHIGKRKPQAAVLSIITDHTYRGKSAIQGDFGPKYELNELGEPELEGLLSISVFRFVEVLEKSHILSRYVLRRRPAKEVDIDLLVAMIEKSARLFSDKYDAPFYCLLWEELHAEEGLYDRLLEKLKAKNIKVIEVSDILPGYDQEPEKYYLYEDIHPNVMANRLIGEYLSQFILEQQDETEQQLTP